MPRQPPRYTLTFEDVFESLYLIGHPEGDKFKYGVSKDPHTRLKQLKRARWGEDLGFDWESAEVLYTSDLRHREVARHAESDWLLSTRDLTVNLHDYTIEILEGSYEDILFKFKRFCESEKSSQYFELSNQWLGMNFGVFLCFQRTDLAGTYIYHSSSYRPVIDVAWIIRQNPLLNHVYTFWGSHSMLSSRLKKMAVTTISDDKFYTIRDLDIAEIMDALLSDREILVNSVRSEPAVRFASHRNEECIFDLDTNCDYL